ncbi:MAG: hypothetical protein GX535_12565 [Xanthomonadaceae bacterium]|nr:hypothetical protein [Xanthomonadaceae bacterium]
MYARFKAPLKRTALVAFLAAVTLLGPVSAQQTTDNLPLYDVEIVIFRHLASDATEEVWSYELSRGKGGLEIPEEDATPFDPPASASVERAMQTFPPLAAGRMKLSAIEDSLRRSRNYRPLAHFGWTQPGYARHTAPSISVDELVPPGSGVTGQIALSRGRYLHLTLDLTFAPPDSPDERYVLRHSRRMRSNERHYIDHPKFGVIAVITPNSG